MLIILAMDYIIKWFLFFLGFGSIYEFYNPYRIEGRSSILSITTTFKDFVRESLITKQKINLLKT